MKKAIEYSDEQNKLPMKFRFKMSTIHELTVSVTTTAQLLFEKNSDFLSLCAHDQSILLEHSIRHTAGLGGLFIFYKAELMDCRMFFDNITTLYEQKALHNCLRCMRLLAFDFVFVKLCLVILILIPIDHTYYADTKPIYLNDGKTIFHIQNLYIELTWRYLLYRYGHRQAVLAFSNLIRTFFALDKSIAGATEVQEYNSMIETLVQQTEETLGKLD